MALLQSRVCFRCNEFKPILNEDIYCLSCNAIMQKEAEDAALQMLSDLSVDERINRLERLAYQLVYQLMKASAFSRNSY